MADEIMNYKNPLPQSAVPDSTVALSLDPYRFVSKTCARLNTDVFQTRIMLKKAVCMRGPEATQLFYDRNRFMRSGAAPSRIEKTLFGRGGV